MHQLLNRKSTRFLFAALTACLGIFAASASAWAQGCVNARQCTHMLDPQMVNQIDRTTAPAGESWLSPRRFTLSVDYRYLHSHRHFVGTDEQEQRATQRSEVNNIVHTLNVAATYDINPRFSLALNVPVFIAKRFGQSTPTQATYARGIGDISIMGRMWLLRPPAESRQNVAFGLGLKLPTGKDNAKYTVTTPTGPVTRIVDQSIQPGDGGYGMVMDFQAYKAVKSVTLIASGLYLVNPKRNNGVLTGRSRPSEAVMSVADQYVYRAGAVFPFPKVRGLSWSMGIRGEGVPSTDLIGKSDGFRRPGYAISVEPGLSISRGKGSWNFSVPVAVRRNRTRSVPDILENRHGDAAFADYVILAGYSKRF